jgi:hypothetical protein
VIFAMIDDFSLTVGGTLREATRAESIIQDVAHMLNEIEAVGDPTADDFMADVRSQILDLLNDHPQVTSIQAVTFAVDRATNRLAVSLGVNDDASPLIVTSSGAQ